MEAFEYDIPSKPVVSGDEDTDVMERAMYMERMAEYRKAKAIQNSINIQLYSELYNELHEDSSKKLLDDSLCGEVERKQDLKGLMIAVTKIMLLPSCSVLYSSECSCMLMLFCMAFAFLYSAMRSICIALSMTSAWLVHS